MGFFKNLLTDYKPLLNEGIHKVVQDEDDLLDKLFEIIVEKVKYNKGKSKLSAEIFLDYFDLLKSKPYREVENASLKEASQVLYQIAPSSFKYDSDDDTLKTKVKSPKYHGVFDSITEVKLSMETDRTGKYVRISTITDNINDVLRNMIDFAMDSNPEVWTDPDTSLMWQVEIEDKQYEWKDIQRCADRLNSENYGGYSDWRLPNVNELRSLGNIKFYSYHDKSKNDFNHVDDWKKKNINKGYENSESDAGVTYIKKPLLDSMYMYLQWFWSSTQDDEYSSKAWAVIFDLGCDGNLSASYTCYVRCVR